MRATSLRLLLVPAALLAAAGCDDSPSPQEPLVAEEGEHLADGVPARHEPAFLAGRSGRWADGYLLATDRNASHNPDASHSYNRAGGPITVTKPAGTTGRYIVTFRGLSSVLGGKNTLRVTATSFNGDYCKPVGAYLVSDKAEVRCFRTGTGAPVNSQFTLLVTRNYADVAFAYAHLPTGTNYSPSAPGSWNPAGTTNVLRIGVGQYRVSFKNLGLQLPNDIGGHVQVNAVGAGKARCKARDWNRLGNVDVDVRCYTPAGAPADAKFTVLFVRPAAHLAYAYADSPGQPLYSPHPFYGSNPTGGETVITRREAGLYVVSWTGVDPEIIDGGDVQVAAHGPDNAHCNVVEWSFSQAIVRCFAPNGAPVDTYYTVLLHS